MQSATSATCSTCDTSTTSHDDRQPGLRAGTPRGPRAPAPRAPGTSTATSAACTTSPRRIVAPAALAALRREQRLLLALDRARPGDQRERPAPDRRRADVHGGRRRVQVGGHHLVGLADLDRPGRRPGAGRERDRLEPLGVADETDDRVDRAARDERLAAGGADAFGDAPRRRPRWPRASSPRPSRSFASFASPGPTRPVLHVLERPRERRNPGLRPGVPVPFGSGDYAGQRPP